MDPITILMLVLIVLALGGFGYGAYAGGPVGGGPSPLVSSLGILALILIVAFIVMLATGWRFGFEIAPPTP
jgi:hypothetical protein